MHWACRNHTAADPGIDALRARMTVAEDKQYSRDYLDPDKRSIANAVQVFFKDGSSTAKVAVEYPIGHRRRRAEGIPVLREKARAAFAAHFGGEQAARLMELFTDFGKLAAAPVSDFCTLLTSNDGQPVSQIHKKDEGDV